METSSTKAIKATCKRLVAEGELLKAIEQAVGQLSEFSDKRNIFIQLEREYKELKIAQIKNLISYEQAQQQLSRLTANLLSLLDILEENDFSTPSEGKPPVKKNKAGSVLYSIPSVMEVQQEKQCVVRLAFLEELLLDNYFAGHDTQIRDLRKIDSNMEVEIVDPAGDSAFAIRTISSVLQKVERDDYTEWLFFIKPLKQGTFPLYLKVSIITKEDGEKIRKELVLQEYIEVVAKMSQEVSAGLSMKHSGFVFFLPAPLAATDNDQSDQEKARSQKSTSKYAVRAAQIIGAFALVLGIWWYKTAGTSLVTEISYAQNTVDTLFTPPNKLTITPPFQGIEVPANKHLVLPGRDTILHLSSGSEIKIPASTFVNEQGEPVLNPVEILLTEYLQPHEIIASGIPMKVRSRDGHDDWMQTAGMFDIKGFCNGAPVYIAKGKSLVVSLNSPVQGEYPFWKFETDQGNWRKVGTANSIATESGMTPENRNALEKEVAQLRKKTEKQPKNPMLSNVTFKNEVPRDELDNFPELKGRRDIVWLYAGSPDKLPAKMVDDQFNPPDIEAGPQPGQYWLTYKNTSVKHKLLMVLKPGEAELELFKKAEQEYQNNLFLLAQKEALLKDQTAFLRSMSIQSFGIYNYDKMWKEPDAVPFAADFDFGDTPEELKKQIIVYLITGDDQVVVSFPSSDWGKFSVNPNANNRLVAILPGNKMASFTQKDFKRESAKIQQAAKGAYTFKMTVMDRPVESLPEVKKSIVASI